MNKTDIYDCLINELENSELNTIESIEYIKKLHNEKYKFIGSIERFEIKKNNNTYLVLSLKELEGFSFCEPDFIENNIIQNDYGIYIKKSKMAEFVVDFSYYPDNRVLHSEYEITKQLDIGNVHIEIGYGSEAIWPIISNLYYSDFRPDYPTSITTIKLFNVEENDFEKKLFQAVFIINAYFLNKKGFYLCLLNSFAPMYIEWDEKKVQKYLSDNKKVSIPINIEKSPIEMICLYTQAQALTGDKKFLCLYRIIEYYADYNLLSKFKQYRFNNNVKDDFFFDLFIKTKDESKMLNELITDILNEQFLDEKFSNTEIFQEKNKSRLNLKKFFAEKLYEYRNSIVHSKYKEINRSKINSIYPEQFDQESLFWCDFVNEFALGDCK